MSAGGFFHELQDYVGFGHPDQVVLRALHPGLAPDFPEVSEIFYARILEYPPARAVLERGESSVGRLKHSLVIWMDGLFQGPWDDAYLERRARIGRVHVRIGLPQHYMFGAMNLLRRELSARISRLVRPESAEHHVAQDALSRMLDLELAIMLQTYREDLEAQKARTERLSTFGQVAASIGHELRNPLGVAESSVFLLEKRVGTDPSAQKHLRRIGEQIAVASGIVSALLDLVRDRPMDAQALSLGEVVQSALARVPHPEGLKVEVRPLDGLQVMGDAAQLRQVFVNLVQNAVEACGETGEVRIEGRVENGMVEVSVDDTGHGVDASVRSRLFEPLITTKTKGIGLGLALVRRIAERHGGTIVHFTPPTRGARFVLTLPAVK
ncbi:MAG TPA: protoglobin domain-containing protein [Myxococcaceae bacterium]|nr:protoglobin domain-containing protein [Myxococcaceae bacterium]